MSSGAKVTSVEALTAFRAALVDFSAKGRDALSANDMEIQRAFAWLEDQLKYWRKRVRLLEQAVTKAKNDLHHRELMGENNKGVSCEEQEEALKLAKKRLKDAEQKVEKCKRWLSPMRRSVDEYHGSSRRLANLLEFDLIQILAQLSRGLDALEAYLKIAAPALSTYVHKRDDDDSVARSDSSTDDIDFTFPEGTVDPTTEEAEPKPSS